MPRNSEEEREFGVPRTEAERATRHEALYPGEPLPPRGSGYSRTPISGIGEGEFALYAPYIIPGLFAVVSALIVAHALKKN